MKVQATQQSYHQNFRGADDIRKATKIASKAAEKAVDGTLPKVRNAVHSFLYKNDGEKQTQLINGMFTATLAPLMIKHNPFSKKDQKQKDYSAIRQPISAGIAVTGGLAMTEALNRWMDAMCNSGAIESIDGRMAPTDTYLKSQFAKELKKAKSSNSTDAFYNKYAADAVQDGIVGKELKEAALKGFKETKRAERKELFIALMSEKPENIVFDQGVISVNGKKLAENIPNMTTKEQFDKFIAKNNLHKISFADYMKKNFNITKYAEDAGELNGQLTPSAKKAIKGLKTSDMLKKLGVIGENTIKEGAEIDEATVKEIYKSISNSNSEGYISKLMGMSTADAISEITKGIKGTKNSLFNSNIDFSSVVKNTFKVSTDALGTNFKNFKKYTGIGFNLPMTAITCTVLNWVYPRFVEKFRPDLLPKAKTQVQKTAVEGGNK